MPLRHSQQIQQSQRLSISFGMQQALNILSLSQEELNQTVQKELLENPFLELKPMQADFSHQNSERAPGPTENIPQESFFSSSYNRAENNRLDTEENLIEPESLKSHVLKQVEMSCFSKSVKAVLPLLISHLDDRGRLNLRFEEIAEKERISYSAWEKAVSALQSLEPLGVGAFSLEDCLLIQLRMKKAPPQAESIVKNHLHNIKEGKFQRIAFDLNISLEETFRLCRLIQSLEPYPARAFAPSAEICVRPDIYIYKQAGEYKADLNTDDIPELKISRRYERLLKIGKQSLSCREKEYLSEKAAKARWFLQALKLRHEKIKTTASLLAQRQKDFF